MGNGTGYPVLSGRIRVWPICKGELRITAVVVHRKGQHRFGLIRTDVLYPAERG